MKSFPLITPKALIDELPLHEHIQSHVYQTRQAISNLIHGTDKRLLVILGPCSIAQPQAALSYATKLAAVMPQYEDRLLCVMRAYVAKARTTVGWKGLVYDPHLTGQADVNYGLQLARQLFIDINQMGVPIGTEWLDPTLNHYLSDCVAWGSIGARTVESPIHRELASQLPMPIGFKNSTLGNIQVAIDAMQVARTSHNRLGLNIKGHTALMQTPGNENIHLILRGSHQQSNYDLATLQGASLDLRKTQLPTRIMIDCSHGNSDKDYRKQIQVIEQICGFMSEARHCLLGVMIESHLQAGRQDLIDPRTLNFGQSITDPCLAWEETLPLLDQLYEKALAITPCSREATL